MESILTKFSKDDKSRRKIGISIDLPLTCYHAETAEERDYLNALAAQKAKIKRREFFDVLIQDSLDANTIATVSCHAILVDLDEYVLAHLAGGAECPISWTNELEQLKRLAKWNSGLDVWIPNDGGYKVDSDLSIVKFTPESEYGEGG